MFDPQVEIEKLRVAFEAHSNDERAGQMERYMKGHFPYFGIQSKDRKAAQAPFMTKGNRPPYGQLWDFVFLCWEQDEREFQYFAMELIDKYLKQFEEEDIQHLEKLILSKSWWDSVDKLSAHHVGAYFKKFPEQIPEVTEAWMESGNMWLQRSCILFQLKYKLDLDENLLDSFIDRTKHSKEFFLRKAIGWALRQHARVAPAWVKSTVEKHELQGLSRREALKHIS